MIPRTNTAEGGWRRRDRSESLLSNSTTGTALEAKGPSALVDAWRTLKSADVSERRLHKRRSFFGRSNSDASSIVRGSTPTSAQVNLEQHVAPRPTAFSETRRRKTEPMENIRNSIFGGRKKLDGPASRDVSSKSPLSTRPASRDELPVDPGLSREHFRSEEDYYRYLRKISISPPFNFQHVAHTVQKQLPPLETVDERELKADFWAASAYQKPRRHLHGIKADNLSQKLPSMGIERGAASSRPTSPVPAELAADRGRYASSTAVPSSIDETMFDEVNDTRFDPDDALRVLHSRSPPRRYPKRYSSLGALNEDRQRDQNEQPTSPTFYESGSSSESEALTERIERATLDANETATSLDAVAEEREAAGTQQEGDYIDRTTQPLPPLPPHAAVKKPSKSSLRPSDPGSASIMSLACSSDRPSSTKSKRSSRSTYKSPAVSDTTAASDVRRPSIMSDATYDAWEDDVDFCYQQEAESTCDFDWNGSVSLREPSIAESDGGVRLSAWIAPAPMSASSTSTCFKPGTSSDEPHAHHTRASSVGHRGFLAARRGSPEVILKRGAAPGPLTFTPSSTQVSILSPVFSVTGADEETPKTPFTPASSHYEGLKGRLSTEELSDPESVRTGGSRHRKSSSYGSYESAARQSSVSKETTRWSMASSSSVPDLLHARRKSKLGLQRSMISRPLESLPQSPGTEHDEGESTIVPRASQIEPMRNAFIVRRPLPQEEHGASQSTGRTSQRYRPPTPSRQSRLLQVDGASAGTPGWI